MAGSGGARLVTTFPPSSDFSAKCRMEESPRHFGVIKKLDTLKRPKRSCWLSWTPPPTLVFDTPKPTRLIRRILQIATSPSADDIVLDFFAGSGSTLDAVFRQNAEESSKLRCILVQLPEPLTQSNDNGPSNIAALTKERLRRAATKVKVENPMFAGDLGFRVFKLDTSNIRTWEPDRDDLERTLLANIDHIKPNRSEKDILYELLLKLGLDLCAPIKTLTIAGKPVHSIVDGTLVACLVDRIAHDDIEPLALGITAWHRQLVPANDSTVVFRNSAFIDDVAKTNLTAILQQNGLANMRSL